MAMRAEQYRYVIGGDPDRDTIDLAVLDTATGGVRAHLVEAAHGPGYARMLAWADEHAPQQRVWALEGTGSFAAGLAQTLAEAGEAVVEVGAVKRARGAKNDHIDAVRAARSALAREFQTLPRARGLREALRMVLATRAAVLVSRTKAINELKSLIIVAPEHLRAQLRGLSLARQLSRIEALQTPPGAEVEHRVTISTLRSIAARVRFLQRQAKELDPELASLVSQHAAGPALLAEPGVGPVVAAQLLVSWSHRGRVRNEAAFAALAGTSPLEASSGQRIRHRLNRGGDRDLNRALHTVAITRVRCHAETRAYHAAATARGKTRREIRRSLKRALARRLYRRMQAATRPAAERPTAA
ncbi:IS110 family transposase [Pseudonocardia kujensis]|uniref:IS110 family transposase n=1 Tax=Pseudonocardia kujensis TaxID=1128675 RepID=UPI001E3F9A3F|nr:IS110 family transposase [Pseudonocardia kujensis]MCE0768072.1 IS110 family transposase [Pseudonocardia kujensis]